MLWIDKHCPRTFDELICHESLNKTLKKLAKEKCKDIPHLLFYGPSGGGKKTRIYATLRAVFGDSVDKIRADNFTRKDISTDLVVAQSPHHMQLSCAELGSKDRVIVQHLIKDLSSNAGALSLFTQGPSYRVFVFQDSELLSEGAQAGLRRTLEKYIKNSRAFLHTQQLSSLIGPLRSRCLCIRVPLPTVHEVQDVLRRICDAEEISPSQASDSLLLNIANRSERNLRRAILMLETTATQQFTLTANALYLPWEEQINEIVEKIMKVQTPKMVAECRDMVYDLLSCCIPGEIILLTMTKRLLENPRIKPHVHPLIIQAAAHFAHTLRRGSKEAWHIEAFIAHAMSAIKTHQNA